MRKHFIAYILLFVVFGNFMFPEFTVSETMGTVPGNISLHLFKSGTGSESSGVTNIYVSLGDTITIDAFVRNLSQVPVSAVELYFTVNENYFNIVSQGMNEEKNEYYGQPKPFKQGQYFRNAFGSIPPFGNNTFGDILNASDNGFQGWQLNYVEITGPDVGSGRPVSRLRYGVVATFQLIAKAPCDSVTLRMDYDTFHMRITRYFDPNSSDSFSFSDFKTCYITVTGATINPPLPDIFMLPGTTDDSLDLDEYIGLASLPDSMFIWQATGNNRISVSINQITHVASFTAPADYQGYEDIVFAVGSVEQPTMASDTLRVTVDYPPAFTDALPNTIFIYEDSLQVAFYLPNIVEDNDDDFTELIWTFQSVGNITMHLSGANSDTLKLKGVQNFNGLEHLSINVKDSYGLGDSKTVPVRVYPVNDPPTLAGLPDVEFERTKSYTFDMKDYANDVDDDPLNINYDTPDSVKIQIDGTTVTISESEGFLGSRDIVFYVTDTFGLSASDTMRVTVTPLKGKPLWSKIPKIGFPQNGSFNNMILWDYIEDPDGEDSELSFEFSNYDDVDSIYVSPLNGRLYLYDLDNTPGWDMITVKATDFDNNSASTQFLVFIGPADGTPIVGAIPDTTIQAGVVTDWIDLDDYYYDVDNTDDDMKWTWSHAEESGLVIVEINNISRTTRLRTENPDSTGIDRIIFTVTDPGDKFASDDCLIKVIGKTNPLLDIPAKIGFITGNKAIIDLDDYAADPDFSNPDLTWNWTGNQNIEIEYESEYLTYTRPIYFTNKSQGWTGWEKVKFEVRNPIGGSAVDSTTVFCVPGDGTPVAGGLEYVRVRAGYCDSLNLDLDDFYFDADSNDWEMSWTVSGNDSTIITIDTVTHAIKFCAPSETFEGRETITLTVSDGLNSDSMDVTVIVYGAVIRNVFSMLLFRNPMQSDYMDIYIKSGVGLFQAPSLEVRVEGDTTLVNMKAVMDTLDYYYGSYLLPYEASLGLQKDAVLIADGTTKTGKSVQDTLSFVYGRLGAAGGKITLGAMTVDMPEGALKTPEMLTLVANNMENDSKEKPAVSEISFSDKAYTLGPVSLATALPMDISFSVCCREDGAGIYRLNNESWEFVGGTHINRSVYAKISFGGTYCLGYDKIPPKIKILDSKEGSVAFSATDYGSGIDMNSIEVMYNGVELQSLYDFEKSGFIIKLPDIVNETDISLKVSLSDKAGNETVEYINTKVEPVPGQFYVEQNVPNPFNPYTTITFITTSDIKVKIEIYDILGRKVRDLTDGFFPAGTHKVIWDATDNSDRIVSSGIYLYSVITDSHIIVRKMVFIR